MKHGEMSPSVMLRRLLCPGSHWQEKSAPAETQSEAASSGSRNHQLMADYGVGKLTELQVLEAAGDDHYALAMCIEAVSRVRAAMPHAHMICECELDHSFIHPAIGIGTADLLAFEPWVRGEIIDYKFTHEDPPPARFNIQTSLYAAGAAREYDLREVTTRIICAYSGRESYWTYSREELANVESKCRAIVEAALAPWAPLRPGVEACKYCRANTTCPAILAIAAKMGEKMRDSGAPEELPGSTVGALLAEADILGTWLRRLQAQATRLLMAGGEVDGWEMREGRSTRGWADNVTAAHVQEIAKKIGKDADKVLHVEMVSPNKLEQSWGRAKKVKEALENLIVKKPGAPKLTRKDEMKEE